MSYGELDRRPMYKPVLCAGGPEGFKGDVLWWKSENGDMVLSTLTLDDLFKAQAGKYPNPEEQLKSIKTTHNNYGVELSDATMIEYKGFVGHEGMAKLGSSSNG